MDASILLVEDDEAISSGLLRVFGAHGFAVRHVAHGTAALREAEHPGLALVILDLGLPDMDGIEVCRRVRAIRPGLAVLILSARDQEPDIVAGLDAGADDYLVKPFRLSELLARVRAHLRRAAPPLELDRDEVLEAGGVRIDATRRRAWQHEQELALSPKEFELLSLLVTHAGRVLTRERIMGEIWHTEWLGSTRTLDTHVLALRGKLGGEAITTLRGVGYRFEAE